MKLSDFNYTYPKNLIAQRPLPGRDESRMMLVERVAKSWLHSNIAELPKFLRAGDVLVVNDSKVVPARLFGTRGGRGEVEILVVEPHPEGKGFWRCLLKKAKRVRAGEKFFFGMQATATAHERHGIFLVLEFKGDALELAMKHHGVPPLPPYIEREGIDAYTDEDRERYQTVFAKNAGSAAAPTAGLHLSEELLRKMNEHGAEVVHVTLHVGIDTFAPLRNENIDEHTMHGERFEISEAVAKSIALAKREGRRVIAVGTTSTRAVESAAAIDGEKKFEWGTGHIMSGSFTTNIFIKPGFKFGIVDAMLTNFHQPKSTLLVMVSAFAGREFILSCYEEAIREKYRLFSYGDCMLIV